MKIRELLSDESKWTQGEVARDALGFPLGDPTAPEASCWCLTGAITRCYGIGTDAVSAWMALERGAGTWPRSMSIVDWNDDPARTFADVRALIERLDI